MLGRILQRKHSQDQAKPATASFSTHLTPEDINLTDAASDRMRDLSARADVGIQAIRIFVMGGGCNGMTYGMTYAEEITEYDTVLEHSDYRIAVDAVALGYLQGCTIDYVRQGVNESFVFKDVFQSVGGSGACGGCAAAGTAQY